MLVDQNTLEQLQFAIVTVSDSRSAGDVPDTATGLLEARICELGGSVIHAALIPDDPTQIAMRLRELTDEIKADVVVTTGGTGLGPRDRTPEATLEVADLVVPGLAELMRAESALTTSRAWLSRAVVVVRGPSLIANLPGSPRGAVECLNILAPHVRHALHVVWGGGHRNHVDAAHTGQSGRT